jgi:hypothetical protein
MPGRGVWVAINPPPPLEYDYFLGRNMHKLFKTEESMWKSLARGMDRIIGYYDRWGGENLEESNSDGDAQEQRG